MADTKEITFQAYDIPNTKFKIAQSDLFEKMSESLDGTVVKNRTMKLMENKDHSPELLLNWFEKTEDHIFGCVVKLVYAKEFKTLPEDFLDKETINMSEMMAEPDNNKIKCTNFCWFAMNSKYLVANFSSNEASKNFEKYINWLIRLKKKEDQTYTFNPKISKEGLKLSSVTSIKMMPPSYNQQKVEEKKENNEIISKFAYKLLPSLISDINTVKSIEENNLVSAELTLKIKKRPKEMREDAYRKTLSACMKPIVDPGSVEIKTKGGKTFKGNEILHTVTLKIPKNDNGELDEKVIRTEMLRYLDSLK